MFLDSGCVGDQPQQADTPKRSRIFQDYFANDTLRLVRYAGHSRCPSGAGPSRAMLGAPGTDITFCFRPRSARFNLI